MQKYPSSARHLPSHAAVALFALGGLVQNLAGCAGPEYVPPEVEKPKGPLSLEEAVDLAFRNSPDVEAAVNRVTEAQKAIDEAISHYWPALQFVESFTMTDRPSQAFGFILDQKRFDPSLSFNNPGITSNWSTAFTGSVTLYDGGRRRARWRRRVAEANSAAAQAELVRRDLALEVARAYFTIHKAREMAATQEKSIETLRTHLRITEARRAEGAARRSEVLAVRVRLAETQEAAIVARNAAERALAGLRVLLGLEVVDPLELTPPEVSEPAPRETLDRMLMRAVVHRMEIVEVYEQVEAAEARVREAVAHYHPEVTLFGAFSFEDQRFADLQYGNWTWGVSFLKSITDIFRAPILVDQAAAQRDATYAAARKVLLEVELDVKNALLDGEEADARHDVSAQAMALAEESLRLVEEEYKQGAATITRLLEAELALTQARTRHSATAYDRALSRIVIAHSVGEYPEEPSEAEPHDEGGAVGGAEVGSRPAPGSVGGKDSTTAGRESESAMGVSN